MRSSPRARRRQETDPVGRVTRRGRSRRLTTPDGLPRYLHVERLEDRLLLSFAPANSAIEVDGTQADPLPTDTAEVVSMRRTTAEDANNDFVDVWEQSLTDAQLGIFIRLFDESGVPQGSPAYVPGTTATDTQATVAMSAAESSVVAWTHSINGTGSGPTSVELQEYQGTTLQGSTIVIKSAFAGGSTAQPSVAYEGSDIVVAYTDSNASGSVNQVKAAEIAGGVQTPLTVAAFDDDLPAERGHGLVRQLRHRLDPGRSAFNQVASGYVIAEEFTSAVRRKEIHSRSAAPAVSRMSPARPSPAMASSSSPTPTSSAARWSTKGGCWARSSSTAPTWTPSCTMPRSPCSSP